MPPAVEGGTVSLFGNLSLDGAVLKQSGRLAAFAQASRPAPSSSRTTRISTQTGKKNSNPLIKELPLSSGIFSF